MGRVDRRKLLLELPRQRVLMYDRIMGVQCFLGQDRRIKISFENLDILQWLFTLKSGDIVLAWTVLDIPLLVVVLALSDTSGVASQDALRLRILFFSKISVGDLQRPSIRNKKCSVSRVTITAELKSRYKFSVTRHTPWTPGRNGTVHDSSHPMYF
jgi:hypothetical protein